MTNITDKRESEIQRLNRIKRQLAHQNASEPLFKEIVALATEVCRSQFALINLIDHKNQWFKASVGLKNNPRIERDIAFFSHAILQNEVVEIQDSHIDQRIKNNPLVKQNPNIRFYAGMPIIMPSGKKIGTISVMDQRIYALSPLQQIMFEDLGKLSAQALTQLQQASQPDGKKIQLTELGVSSSDVIARDIEDEIKGLRKRIEAIAA